MTVHGANRNRPTYRPPPPRAQTHRAQGQRPTPGKPVQAKPAQPKPASGYTPPAAKKGPELNGARPNPNAGLSRDALRAKAAKPDTTKAQETGAQQQVAAQGAQRWQQRDLQPGQPSARDATTIGGGTPKVNYHGTPDSKRLEGKYGSMNISVQAHHPKDGKAFDPTKHNGVALTSKQANELGVRSGDKVMVHDRDTGRNYEATYYDNAGPGNFEGARQHMEMTPALAENMGLNVRGRDGRYVNSITGSQDMAGRFEIRRLNQ